MATLRQISLTVEATRSKDFQSRKFGYGIVIDIDEGDDYDIVAREWTARLKDKVREALGGDRPVMPPESPAEAPVAVNGHLEAYPPIPGRITARNSDPDRNAGKVEGLDGRLTWPQQMDPATGLAAVAPMRNDHKDACDPSFASMIVEPTRSGPRFGDA